MPTELAPPGGLLDEEVDSRRERYGPNAIPAPPAPSLLSRVGAQLRDPTIVLLLGAVVLSALLGDFRDVTVIVAVIVVNTVIGVGQELRAEQALEALRAMAAPVAKVWRNGAVTEVAAVDIVPGDRVVVEAGDVVPADAQLVEAAGLEVNEAALTGESEPIGKQAAGMSPDNADSQIKAGTVVTRGRGTALVTATGSDSATGQIAALLGADRTRRTPLQKRLRDLGRILAVAAVVLSVLVLVLGLARGRPAGEMVLTAVSLAVAAVPESLPAVVTLALALGARRMSRRSAIVRRLAAVETLGSVTVFLTDKTGTLTHGRMSVERICTSAREYDVGSARAAVGDGDAAVRAVLRGAVLCNDAELCAPDDQHDGWWVRGEGTEAALLEAAVASGLPVEEVRSAWPRLAECPFDSVRKRMTTVHRERDSGRDLVVCKGAPEVLATLLAPGGGFPPGLRATADRLAAGGYRVLAVAEGTTTGTTAGATSDGTGGIDAAEAERQVHVIGLLALSDPPREDARGVVTAIGEAGVRVAMVTGDHPATAGAIASRLGMSGAVTTGAELDSELSGDGPADAELPAVFARTRPEQKYDIVAALQREGHVVAMTGDGVNDAPALDRADIGVAMGAGGTEVAKQAADLILTDDSLGTVLVAIGEGRRIYENIRTFLRYALAGGLAEVLVMLVGPLVGIGVPLLPAQILWINLLTHGLPGVAFGAEPGDRDAMRRPPRSPQESVLGDGLWHQVLTAGVLMAAAALVGGVLTDGTDADQQSAVFLTLGLAQLGVALALRRSAGRRRLLGFLDVAVASSIVLQVAAVYLPPLARLLGTESVPGWDLPTLVGLAVVPGVVVVASRIVGRWRRAASGPGWDTR
jgi:Ca2+-transporting ATPase